MNKLVIIVIVVAFIIFIGGGYFFYSSQITDQPVIENILTEESGEVVVEEEDEEEEEFEFYASIPWHNYEQQEFIYSNYTGRINGEIVDMYIKAESYAEQVRGSAVIYHPDKSVSGYDFYLSEVSEEDSATYAISIRTSKDEEVFYGTISAERLEGAWTGGEVYEEVSLVRSPLSVTIKSYISEESERIIRLDNSRNEFDAGLVNRKVYTHISKLFEYTEPECDRGTNFEIHCNQQGILSLTVYSHWYCDGPKGTMFERFLVYDLLTGEQLTARKILTRNYERILQQMGYDVSHTDILIYPNGILFTGHFSNWGPGERFFFTWEEILPVLKPESPLIPFLQRSKIISKQTKKAPVVPTKKYSRINDPFNGIRVVKLNDKYGYIDHTGREITPIKYDYAEDFYDTLAFVWIDGKCGVVNMAGEEITPIKYTGSPTPVYRDGVAIVSDGKKYGIINRKGEETAPLQYYSIDSFHEGFAVVTKRYSGDEYLKGYINLSGKEITPVQYIAAQRFNEGMALVELMKGRKTFIDTTGKNIPRSYQYASPFMNGFAVVKNNDYYGFINKAGDEITKLVYEECGDFDEYGYGKVKTGAGWGYIDTTGVEVIYPKYSYVYSFDKDGLGWVHHSNEWYVYIDKDGNEYETRQEYYNLLSAGSVE